MTHPDLSTPEGRAVHQAELRTVAIRWGVAGVGMVQRSLYHRRHMKELA